MRKDRYFLYFLLHSIDWNVVLQTAGDEAYYGSRDDGQGLPK